MARSNYCTFVSRILRKANRSVMYIREARKGVENSWSLADPAGTFKVLPSRWATESLLAFFFPRVPCSYLPSLSAHIRWRIVLLKRVLLSNDSLFLSLSASSFFPFFFLPTASTRGSNSHHCRRWNSDRKIRENDRAAARHSSKAVHEELTLRNLARVTTLAVELEVEGHLFPTGRKSLPREGREGREGGCKRKSEKFSRTDPSPRSGE